MGDLNIVWIIIIGLIIYFIDRLLKNESGAGLMSYIVYPTIDALKDFVNNKRK